MFWKSPRSDHRGNFLEAIPTREISPERTFPVEPCPVFGRKAKIRKAVDRAFAADPPDHAPIEALPAEDRPTAYFNLGHALVDDERYAAAKRTVERALELAP